MRIAGVDRPSVLAHAQASGAIDRTLASIGDAADADLIVLAAPVRQNVALLGDVAAAFGRPAGSAPPPLVTDVGGTKRDIVAAAASLPPHLTFIGGHPIGGAERGGFGFARPDLFTGRPWILTPTPETPAPAIERLSRFVEAFGARPHHVPAAEHDRLMAVVSHLPQLTASALMQVIGAAAGPEGLRLAGRGLIDSTRLASSPAGVWTEICGVNADAIAPALDALIARLTELRRGLATGDAIETTFAQAARWRSELMAGRE